MHGATDRVLVTSAQIPQNLKQATVAIEDRRFYDHHGVDVLGVLRAAWADLRAGQVVQGGSTITQQYIKNAYLGDAGGLGRKIREALLAWQLENVWNKDQILTAYLNTVYYGSGAYGVQAAAETLLPQERAAASTWRSAPCWRRCPGCPAATRRSPTPPTLWRAATSCSARCCSRATSRAQQADAASKAKLGVFAQAAGRRARARRRTSSTT